MRKDEKTGDLFLSPRLDSWEEFFRFRDKAVEADRQAFEEFLAGRKDEVPEKRDLSRPLGRESGGKPPHFKKSS